MEELLGRLKKERNERKEFNGRKKMRRNLMKIDLDELKEGEMDFEGEEREKDKKVKIGV